MEAANATPRQGDCVSHIVHGFETLSDIALRYETTVAALKILNNLRHESVHAGQELLVVPKPATKQKAKIQNFDPTQASEDIKYHTVTEKDTLSTIALIYGMKASELKSMNELPSNHLTKGQKLKVKPMNLTPRRIRQRSRSLNSQKVLRVFSPTDFASIKVPSGTIPHIVSNGQKMDEIAELYDMEIPEIESLNHLSTPELENGRIVFVKSENPVKMPTSPLSLNLTSISDPLSIPSNIKGKLKKVETIFEEFRKQGAKYAYVAPIERKNIIREPCRYLVGDSPRTILGVATITADTLDFEPHPQDKEVKSKGAASCRFQIKIAEIFAPLISKEEEVNHTAKGLSLDFGVPGSLLRYIQISKLVVPEDELSDVEKHFYLAMHTDRIESFYCALLEALCTCKEDHNHCNQPESTPTALTPRGTNSSVAMQPGRVSYKKPAPLLEKSTILRSVHSEGLTEIRNMLPARYAYRPWTLVYGTDKHGFSLRTFYDKASQWEVCLLFIEDSRGHVFGGFSSAPWEVNDSFFGSGETFLYRLFPRADLYPWVVSSNSYFMYAKSDHFEMGGGGKPGIWVDEDLKNGFSGKCKTFQNECLASSEDFEISVMEVWSFSAEIVLD